MRQYTLRRSDGQKCFKHVLTVPEFCDDMWHCSGCRTLHGPREDDCCTCCFGYDKALLSVIKNYGETS